MKNKLITLTETLTAAGFKISGMEVETNDCVRIKFEDLNNLELIVNGDAAKIEEGSCEKEKIDKLKEIIQRNYTIKKELEPQQQDIFAELLNCSIR
ncbi:MAG: hypothetical protein GF308_13040 [Candidatus Heimdallarchaeota archaeon]|nr:hypothetical protein [Candidatus Heimdallarchaeota archaeon]